MPQRKAHVKRIFQIDPDTGELNTSLWVDVLRIDKLPVVFQAASDDGTVGQVINYKFIWNDDINNPVDNIDASNADAQFENANAGRTTERYEIKDPDNPDDRTSSVIVWIVDKLKVNFSADAKTGAVHQAQQFVFNNIPASLDEPNPFPDSQTSSNPPSNRTTSVIKVVNNDLNGLSMSDDDGSNAVIVDWVDYQQAMNDGNTDDSTSLNVEFTDIFKVNFGANVVTGAVGQTIQFVLFGNRTVENMFNAGDPNAVDANGDPCVIRLDPLQVVVNIGRGLAAIFGPRDDDAPAPPWAWANSTK
jgi:hypothetical protein